MTEPPGPREQELASERRGTLVQQVFRRYAVRDGFIEADPGSGRSRWYYPMAAPAALHELAFVVPGDVRTALHFVQEFGSLGYRGAAVDPTEFQSGPDPLPWIWAHANGIRVAMALIPPLLAKDEPGAAKALKSLRLSRASLRAAHQLEVRFGRHVQPDDSRADDAMDLTRAVWQSGGSGEAFGFVYGSRRSIHVQSGPLLADPLSEAASIVSTILSGNFAGMTQQINANWDAEGVFDRFELRWSAESIMACVYFHLAEVALGHDVVVCPECQLPFVRTHRSQVFSPAPPWRQGGTSRCAERAKKRRQRQQSGGR